MKRFEVYRNIRKRALIFGLPVSLFALMMIFVVGSLMVIIFSFSLTMMLLVFTLNAVLYICLIKITAYPQLIQVSQAFPKVISTKKYSLLDYEQD